MQLTLGGEIAGLLRLFEGVPPFQKEGKESSMFSVSRWLGIYGVL